MTTILCVYSKKIDISGMVYVSLVDTEKTIQKNEIDNIIDVDGIVWYYDSMVWYKWKTFIYYIVYVRILEAIKFPLFMLCVNT